MGLWFAVLLTTISPAGADALPQFQSTLSPAGAGSYETSPFFSEMLSPAGADALPQFQSTLSPAGAGAYGAPSFFLQDDSGRGGDHDSMIVRRDGVVMNANHDTLPEGCDGISREHEFTIHAGRAYADGTPGMIFGMSVYEVGVEPCSRVTVTLVNEDDVRHQWMVHGLPRYLYPAGMFHIEAMGGQRQPGTFIVPPEDRTYLIHCDMAQHMEKGMRGQLVVGRGSGDLWQVKEVSDAYYRSTYLPAGSLIFALLTAAAGFAVAFWLARS